MLQGPRALPNPVQAAALPLAGRPLHAEWVQFVLGRCDGPNRVVPSGRCHPVRVRPPGGQGLLLSSPSPSALAPLPLLDTSVSRAVSEGRVSQYSMAQALGED